MKVIALDSSNEFRTFETVETARAFASREGDKSRLWSLHELALPVLQYVFRYNVKLAKSALEKGDHAGAMVRLRKALKVANKMDSRSARSAIFKAMNYVRNAARQGATVEVKASGHIRDGKLSFLIGSTVSAALAGLIVAATLLQAPVGGSYNLMIYRGADSDIADYGLTAEDCAAEIAVGAPLEVANGIMINPSSDNAKCVPVGALAE